VAGVLLHVVSNVAVMRRLYWQIRRKRENPAFELKPIPAWLSQIKFLGTGFVGSGLILALLICLKIVRHG
jgi:hypothetical protein